MMISNYLESQEFLDAREQYLRLNESFGERMIFHVGTGAGLYSELGSMLECMLYCYTHKIQFVLYADDANFSNSGWTDFFEPFCTQSHSILNKWANYRYKDHFRWKGIPLPNLLLRRWILPYLLKRTEHVTWLTQDLFDKFVSSDFKKVSFDWETLGVKNGVVGRDFAKLRQLALRYNKKTKEEIEKRISSLNLTEHYVSIQIRGGDKSEEFDKLIDADYCLECIDRSGVEINSLFVFTDNYLNVERLKEKRPQWNIYTLTREDERGYYNADFNKQSWDFRKDNLLKLFSIVEICINSDLHFGCAEACVNGFIRSAKKPEQYVEIKNDGKYIKKGLRTELKRLFSKK